MIAAAFAWALAPAPDPSVAPTSPAEPLPATPPTAVADEPPTEVPSETPTVAEDPPAPAELPNAAPFEQEGAGAVGSDAPPLPPAPPRTQKRPLRGPWYGRGWLEFGGDLMFLGHLPRGLRILSAGLSAQGGWRPHRWFGLGTQLSTFVSDRQSGRVTDEETGQSATLAAAVPITAWDTLVVRLFVPLPRRIEPIFEVASGFAVERSPFVGRKVWGSVRAGAGFDVYVAPTMTLGFGVDYRLLARRDAWRHAVGGRLRLGFHF
ncbi:MAG TPA: hypothetical protein VG755_14550 [Nannocystaceae bacterium]|nr:hypothetical protein [Nannocystaceae bacterium]